MNIEKWKRVVMLCVAVLCGTACTAEVDGAEPNDTSAAPLALMRDADQPSDVTLFVEEGVELDRAVTAAVDLEPFTEVDFSVVSRNGVFENGTDAISVMAAADGSVKLPKLHASTPDSDVDISVVQEGRTIGSVDVRIVATVRWKKALELALGRQGAVLERGEGYLVVAKSILFDGPASKLTLKLDAQGVPVERDEDEEEEVDKALCLSPNPLPPGEVYWDMGTRPSQLGYSIKPETSSSLRWAGSPYSTQAVDGVYNRGWGCYTAVKVADNCKLAVSTSSLSCCCNALASAFGYTCSTINPVAGHGWPACPL